MGGVKLLAASVGGAALTAALILWRDFFWYHALIVGIAGAALVYWTFRAVENLRRL